MTRMSFAANGSRETMSSAPQVRQHLQGLTTPSEDSDSGGGLMPIILPHEGTAQGNAENDPPKRSQEPISYRSLGVDRFSIRYVIGWPELELIKVGSTSTHKRVKRWTSINHHSELIDLAYYSGTFDIMAETWLQKRMDALWPSAFKNKDEALLILGSNFGGYAEFYRVPVEEWAAVRRLAAL